MRSVAPIAIAALTLLAMIFMNAILGDFNPAKRAEVKKVSWATQAILNQEPLLKYRGAK